MIYIFFGILGNAARLIWHSNQGQGRAKHLTAILFLDTIFIISLLIYPFFIYGLGGFKLLGWYFLGSLIGESIGRFKGLVWTLFYLSPVFYIGLFFFRDFIQIFRITNDFYNKSTNYFRSILPSMLGIFQLNLWLEAFSDYSTMLVGWFRLERLPLWRFSPEKNWSNRRDCTADFKLFSCQFFRARNRLLWPSQGCLRVMAISDINFRNRIYFYE